MSDQSGPDFSTMSLALQFQNGAVGDLLGSYDSSYAYRETHRLEINGTRGRVLASDTVRQFSFQARGDGSEQVWRDGYFNDGGREFQRTFDRHMDAILEAFRAGETPPIPAQASLRALQLAFAPIESFESGRRVSVPPVS